MPDIRQFPAVPLIGQPLEVLGWTIVVNVRCKCDRPSIVMMALKQSELGQHADLGICPGCARPMHIAQMTMNAQGLLEFGIQRGESAMAANQKAES